MRKIGVDREAISAKVCAVCLRLSASEMDEREVYVGGREGEEGGERVSGSV